MWWRELWLTVGDLAFVRPTERRRKAIAVSFRFCLRFGPLVAAVAAAGLAARAGIAVGLSAMEIVVFVIITSIVAFAGGWIGVHMSKKYSSSFLAEEFDVQPDRAAAPVSRSVRSMNWLYISALLAGSLVFWIWLGNRFLGLWGVLLAIFLWVAYTGYLAQRWKGLRRKREKMKSRR